MSALECKDESSRDGRSRTYRFLKVEEHWHYARNVSMV